MRSCPKLARVGHAAERLFWRLRTVADDYGRFEAEPELLLAYCFPRQTREFKAAELEAWRDELMTVDVIQLYEVSGRTFGYFVDWKERRRAKHSKFPDPATGIPTPPGTVEDNDDEDEGDPAQADLDLELQDAAPQWGTPRALVRFYNVNKPSVWATADEKLSPGRLKKCAAYLKAFPSQEFWRCVIVEEPPKSQWLLGLAASQGRDPIKVDLDWLLQKGKQDGVENCLKIREGRYRDERFPARSSQHSQDPDRVRYTPGQ